ncbi:MAG TPA: PKD domain-containing protein, partial [Bacteroidia bacterium]|nr:PKD domain-containing protein [Bacteroidia bacterium]
FSIFVYEPPKATSTVISLGCGHVDVDYTPNKNYADLTQTWIVRDSTGQQVYTSIRKQDTLLVPKGTVYITLVLKALGNCITTYTDTLQIPEHVEVHIQPDTFACQNKEIQVTSTTKDGMAPFHYVWNTSPNDTLTTLTLDTAKGSKYWITVTDAIGCKWWDTVRVRWDTVPKPAFTTTPLCYNVPVSFSNTTTAAQAGSFISAWDFGDTGSMDTSTLKSPVYTYFTQDTFSVKLKVLSDKGCTDSLVSNLIVRPNPLAAFTVNDTGQCLKENRFDFTNQSSVTYGSLSYKWFYGNEDTSGATNPSYIYNKDSLLYIIKLITTSNYQCKDSAFANLTVFPDPIAKFTVNDSQQCVNANNFQFNNTSTLKQGVLSYRWYFGDGDSSISMSSSHIYNQHDTLFALLVATSEKECTDTASRKLVIWPKPMVSFTIDDSSQCLRGNDFSFSNTTTIAYNGGMSYYWEAGDGNTGTGLNYQHTYNSDINYRARLQATSLNGCIDTAGKWVYVRPQPAPAFTINDSAQCANANQYQFNNTSFVKYGLLNYNWDFADGMTSAQANPAKVFTKDSVYRVTLWAITDHSCSDSIGRYAVVYPKPNSSFTINDSTQCVNTDLFIFTNTSTIKSGTMTHRWYFGNGDSIDALNSSYGYSIDSSYKIKLRSVSNFNCSDTVIHTATVFPKPTSNFSINNLEQCLNTNLFSFTGLSTVKQGSLQYYWNFGNGKTASAKDTSIIYSKDSTYTVTLIPQSDEFCYDTLSKQVTVYPVPVVSFSANDSDQCLNTNNFVFNNSSTIKYGSMSYGWDFDGQAGSTVLNPSYTFNKDTFYTVQLKVISDKSCTDSLSKIITVHPLPKVSFSINDTAQCENTDLFSFANTSVIKYGTMQYAWFFGDGDSLHSQHANHDYAGDGIYTINLKAVSNYNCIDSGKRQVWVVPMPQSLFAIDDSSKCENPGIFTFTAKSTVKYNTPVNYQWNFDNSITSAVADTSIKYLANGNYFPKLITGTGDNCYDTFTHKVLVYPKPNPDFTIDLDSQCIHINNFSFTNTTTIDSGTMSHIWQYGDGGTATSQHGQHVYSLDTVFNVWLKSRSAFGCSDSISRQVVVMSKPLIRFTVNDSGQCVNNNLFIFKNTSAIKAGTLNFNWDFGNGVTCNCTDTSVGYNYDSTFRVVLQASSELGCADTISKMVIVHSKPYPSYLVNDTDQCLETQQFNFTGLGTIKSGTFNQNWFFSDGQTSSNINPSVKFNNPGTYQVKLLLTSDFNCKDSATGQVIVYPHPNPDFTGLRTYYCTDYPIATLTPVVAGGIFGGKNMAGDLYTPGFTGSDTISYTVTVNGCSNDTVKYTNVYPLPVLELGLDTTLCRKEIIFLDAGFPNSTYVWQDGARTPAYRVRQPGTYMVTMYNVCDTLTDEINVTYRDYDCNFFFPTAFTPNNDGINDVFIPYFESDVQEMALRVFDRWGQLVFESNNLSKGWTGIFNGEALPQDVYIWAVDLKILEKDLLYKHSASGNVTLLR